MHLHENPKVKAYGVMWVSAVTKADRYYLHVKIGLTFADVISLACREQVLKKDEIALSENRIGN